MCRLHGNFVQLPYTQMLPKVPIVDPGATGGLDFSGCTATVFAGDLFYIFVRQSSPDELIAALLLLDFVKQSGDIRRGCPRRRWLSPGVVSFCIQQIAETAA